MLSATQYFDRVALYIYYYLYNPDSLKEIQMSIERDVFVWDARSHNLLNVKETGYKHRYTTCKWNQRQEYEPSIHSLPIMASSFIHWTQLWGVLSLRRVMYSEEMCYMR